MSLADAVKNGPRVASARAAHIEARIRLVEAKGKAAHDKAAGLRHRANGDGPLAKSRKLRASALEAAADRRRAKANQLRADLAKAKADEAARHAKHVKRTVASTATSGLTPKAAGQPGQGGRAGQDIWQDPPVIGTGRRTTNRGRPGGRGPCERCGERPWTTHYRDPWSMSLDAALGRPLRICDQCAREIDTDEAGQSAETSTADSTAKAPTKGGQPVAKPRKNPPQEVTPHPKVRPETHGVLCPCCGGHHGPDYKPAKGKHCGWCHGHGRGGGANFILAPSKPPSDPPMKGTPAMTVSGEAVNIEQTRSNLDQLKGQVADLRGSFEGISGSLASGGLNQLAGSLASADDALDSVTTQITAAEKHLSDQEAIAEAAQAAGEMHGDKSFYGA